MTEKELTIKAGEELDARLAAAKETGNLVIKDATEDEAVIRETFEREKESSVSSLHLFREDLEKQAAD